MQGDRMLKGNSKNIIAILVIFIITLLIFIVGVEFFQPNTPYNNPSIINREITQLFNKFINSEGRENWLIPVVALFSGLSAFATVYLIWLQQQTIKKHDLEVYTERVISHFFILLDKHRIIINNLKFPFDNAVNPDPPATGYDAIKSCVYTIKIALSDINYINIDYYIPYYDYGYLKAYNVIENVCNIKNDKKLLNIEYFENVINNTFNVLDKHTSYFISQ